MPKPYNVFIVYAREDENYLKELRGHLRSMERAGILRVWCDREIVPGVIWEDAILRNMDTADIILLMVSAAYYDSTYIHEKELQYALERHRQGEANVIPIIVRPCNFKVDPIVSSLQVLPKDARPVTDWPNRDNAWLNVVEGIEKVVNIPIAKDGEVEQNSKDYYSSKNVTNPAEKNEVKTAQTDNSAELKILKKATPALARVKKHNKSQIQPQNIITTPNPKWTGHSPRLITNNLLFEYPTVYVEGGEYMMGSPSNEINRADDECQHLVTLKSFSIGKYPITQKQWYIIMEEEPSDFDDCDDCPVECVSWNDVQLFIEKLNSITGLNYRLPTEQEWEYAARGGRNSLKHQTSGNDNLDNYAWYSVNSDGKPHPVGIKAPNELGLYDMMGNVNEWCSDLYEAYPGCKRSNAGAYRVIRGGAWNSKLVNCGVTRRNFRSADTHDNDVGFRLVSSV
jgi:formylglycine-generating enzyme required for sulfatase activity